jgi:uncharacterized protein YjgD (DUF1641 family)
MTDAHSGSLQDGQETPGDEETVDEETVDEETTAETEETATAESAETAVPPELVAAVEENPEEIARLIDNLGPINDALDASAVATGAMDDGMVQRLAGTGSALGAAADGAATDELADLGEAVGQNGDSLAEGLSTLARLQETGTLDDIVAIADTVSLLSAAMDDEMVTSLAGTANTLGELADTASDDDVARGLESVLHAVGDATSEEPEPVGIVGLARALRDPEVKAGMGVAVALLKGLGESASTSNPTE